MSRSFRKTNIIGNGASSEKYDKRINNRVLRRAVKHAVFIGEEDIFPIMREVSDKWSMRKDGKCYFGNLREYLKDRATWIWARTTEDDWITSWRRMKSK
jgi:hypothetical protein